MDHWLVAYGLHLKKCMKTTKIESVTVSELNLASEDRSRGVGRGHRLLTVVAVFLALCLMAVDFGRLDPVARALLPAGSRRVSTHHSPRRVSVRQTLVSAPRTSHF
jgi:hypothetical protein